MPLTTDPMVDEWLNFYEMNPPLCCLGYLISHDPVSIKFSLFQVIKLIFVDMLENK